MAIIRPQINKIKELKQQPTEGELFLLNYLDQNLDNTAEVYFQPFFNGDRPDIIIINKEKGVSIVEVKDWKLESYAIDERNQWFVKSINQPIKSPMAQAFHYKKAMFDLHVNGLLEARIKSPKVYNQIKTFVYFHNSSQKQLDRLYLKPIETINNLLKSLNQSYKEKSNVDRKKEEKKYEKTRKYYLRKKEQIERDKRLAITNETLKKVALPSNKEFKIETYDSFKRYLEPPFHYAHEGKPKTLTKLQARLSSNIPNENLYKVKGLAGSGKTTVLARKAVNALKASESMVLILTFNLTLCAYIKDRISEVREDFPWGKFHIINYHKFIMQVANEKGIPIPNPENYSFTELESSFFGNELLFKDFEIKESEKFQTILVDETQDYNNTWIRIIKNNFLKEDGEMVLFGDEKQNIYEREIDSTGNSRTPNGFGRWKKLTKNFRNDDNSPINELAYRFKQNFFLEKYEEDDKPQQLTLTTTSCIHINKVDDIDSIATYIHDTVWEQNIPPNDVTILSTQIKIIRNLDYKIRRGIYNERTLTTFETQEMYEHLKQLANNNKDLTKQLNEIRSRKKYGFNLNSGVTKLSTIHSFKGFESPIIFLLINPKDSPEAIYTGLTRAKEQIHIILPKESELNHFFSQYTHP